MTRDDSGGRECSSGPIQQLVLPLVRALNIQQ